MKGFEKGLESMPNLKKATKSVEKSFVVRHSSPVPQASEMQGQCVLWKGELLKPPMLMLTMTDYDSNLIL